MGHSLFLDYLMEKSLPISASLVGGGNENGGAGSLAFFSFFLESGQVFFVFLLHFEKNKRKKEMSVSPSDLEVDHRTLNNCRPV
jgi:hypothetical protein